MNVYGIDDVDESYKIADKLLCIQGMHKDKFSIINTIEELLVGKLNDVSIDENSNKNDKTIRGVLREAQSPIDKIVGYRFLYRSLVKLYGKKEAKRLTGLLYDYTLALADSTSILLPYCWAFDASKLVSFGKPFGQLPSKPVKRLDSYISLLNETLHTMSNHLAGAIAIGTFFIDIGHLLLVKEKKTIEDLKNPEYRDYLKNQYQRFIHGVNSLSRSGGVESPFTNVSLFDRPKLEALFVEYEWYFAVGTDGIFTKVLDPDIVIEFIIELQNIFMEFFDKGDPMNNGMPYRFPIATLNISKKQDKQGNWIIEDKDFLKSCCKKDIYRYNIFCSEGAKVASCCRLISDTEMIALASQANSFGAGGSISLGSHRVVTINFVRLAMIAKTRDEFCSLMKSTVLDAKKVLYAHKELLKRFQDVQLFLKIGWINLDRLFSTVGILGYVEAEEIMKRKGIFDEDTDGLYQMLKTLNDEVNTNNEEFKGLSFNIEQIPAEAMSHRLAKADKILFGEENIPYEIYANQFVPLWKSGVTVWEKMEADGKYNSLLTGGGISHINTGEHITSSQAQRLIEYAVKSNCEHFAITGTFCKCEDTHVVLGDRDTCAICGKPIVTKIARVVGFFTPVEDWNYNKFEFDFKRRREFKNEDFNRRELNG
jgi:ribonucleoside-triphosphate reductase